MNQWNLWALTQHRSFLTTSIKHSSILQVHTHGISLVSCVIAEEMFTMLNWRTLLQIVVLKVCVIFFPSPDFIPLRWLLTIYHCGQPRLGDNNSMWDKVIYIGPALTLWNWEIHVVGRLVNTAEIAAAWSSQEKLERTASMKEERVVKKYTDLNKSAPFLSPSRLFWFLADMPALYWWSPVVILL